jgi:hypothetical protein
MHEQGGGYLTIPIEYRGNFVVSCVINDEDQ